MRIFTKSLCTRRVPPTIGMVTRPCVNKNGRMTTSEITTADPIRHRQLQGRRVRLERELTSAFGARPLCGALIERLVIDLAAVECELAGQTLPAGNAPKMVEGAASEGN